MSRVCVPLNVIGPVTGGEGVPGAMTRSIVMSTLPAEWLLTMRRAPESIHDVTSLLVVPLRVMLCRPPPEPVEGKSALPPPKDDMSRVRLRLPLIFDSTTAALTLLTFSSRRYLLSEVR